MFMLVEKFITNISNKFTTDPQQNIEILVSEIQKVTEVNIVTFAVFNKKENIVHYRALFQNGRIVKYDLIPEKSICYNYFQFENEDFVVKSTDEDLKNAVSKGFIENPLLKYFIGYRQSISRDETGMLCFQSLKIQEDIDAWAILMRVAMGLLIREERQNNIDNNILYNKDIYESIFDKIKVPLFILDSNFKIIRVNEAVCNLLGLNDEKIIGHHPLDFSPENQPDGTSSEKKFKEIVISVISGLSEDFLWQHVKSDGSFLNLDVVVKSLDIQNVQSYLVVFQDNFHNKKIINDLVDARIKAENADRLKSAFLANMSHEIRSPLNAIIGSSEILLNENTTEEENATFLKMIGHASQMLLQLVDDIIDISKIEAGQIKIQKAHVDVNPILDELLLSYTTQCQLRNKENIELILKKGNENGLFVYTDPFRLRQIINNLLSNALKFIDSGYVEFGYLPSDLDEIQFYVKDTGIGIDHEKTHLVFQRFGQVESALKRNKEGAGLGMAICNSLVDLLGGRIWFDTEPGKGTTFYFTLPNNDELKAVQKKIKSVDDWSDRTFLVVDDVKSNYYFIKSVLKEKKVNVIWAQDGKEAVEIVKNNPQISLIMMDIRMPVMDGFMASKEIKAIRPDIKIIAQTAFSQPEDIQNAKLAGCENYLVKPYDFDEIIDAIRKSVKD